MLEELRKIVDDFRLGRNIQNILFALFALVISALGVFGVVNPTVVSVTILTVLAVFLYGHAQNRRHLDELIEKSHSLDELIAKSHTLDELAEKAHTLDELAEKIHIPGIKEFSPDRSTTPKIDELISGAQEEVILIGVALTSIVQAYRSLLEKLAIRGCSVKIAVWKPPDSQPENRILIEKLEDLIDEPDTGRSHPSNILRLKHWYSSLDESTQQNVDIRGYSNFPTLSIIFVDKDTSQGYVHVEPIIFKAPTEKLPSFRLNLQDSTALFSVLKNSYTKLWENSTSLVTDDTDHTMQLEVE